MGEERKEGVLLTGFGRFAGIETNPTEELIDTLPKPPSPSLSSAHLITQVLPVNARAADEQLHSAFASLTNPRILLHLGVAQRSDCFALELVAQNTAHFQQPDEGGFQPLYASVDASCTSNELRTRADVDWLCQELRSHGFPVYTSTDAGTFVCNYTYFRSLQLANDHSMAPVSLFVHVPPFDHIGYIVQLHFLSKVLELLAQSYIPSRIIDDSLLVGQGHTAD